MSSIVLLAHGGQLHWYDFILYLVPMIVVAVLFAVDRWRRGKNDDSARPRQRPRPKR